jgi:hypothetical protein
LLGWNNVEKSCLQCGNIIYRRNPLLGQGRLDVSVDFDDNSLAHPPDRGGEGQGDPR